MFTLTNTLDKILSFSWFDIFAVGFMLLWTGLTNKPKTTKSSSIVDNVINNADEAGIKNILLSFVEKIRAAITSMPKIIKHYNSIDIALGAIMMISSILIVSITVYNGGRTINHIERRKRVSIVMSDGSWAHGEATSVPQCIRFSLVEIIVWRTVIGWAALRVADPDWSATTWIFANHVFSVYYLYYARVYRPPTNNRARRFINKLIQYSFCNVVQDDYLPEQEVKEYYVEEIHETLVPMRMETKSIVSSVWSGTGANRTPYVVIADQGCVRINCSGEDTNEGLRTALYEFLKEAGLQSQESIDFRFSTLTWLSAISTDANGILQMLAGAPGSTGVEGAELLPIIPKFAMALLLSRWFRIARYWPPLRGKGERRKNICKVTVRERRPERNVGEVDDIYGDRKRGILKTDEWGRIRFELASQLVDSV